MGSIPDRWSETSWEKRQDLAVPMWHKSQVPYASLPNKLQHVDVWIPAEYTPQSESLSASWLPHPETIWVIWIHGGAWRDPLTTSDSLTPMLKCLSPTLFESQKSPIAFASISYSLSPDPRPSTVPSDPYDYSRNALHPRHILDVLEAISFLQQRAGFGNNYILTGQSCGATLAFQAAMSPERWGINSAKAHIKAPSMLLGLNGLYAMPELVEKPGGKHDQYRDLYEQFTQSAFGPNKELWAFISPASVKDWAMEWPDGKYVMLVQSHEDSLVPFGQVERMMDSLLNSKQDRLEIELLEGYGDHDDIWEKGTLFAEVLAQAIGKLS
ncbi:hypothetical protein QQS21_011351 [Conoideocrella luteorostrata]|uniref:Kynurenine formamidase n=1 Tax=Conoideocrella luteorostrata TaxID=1105319 RepID=A0AAJ0FVY7_9HYPO|nr:hypothetical protein QQS21_011351 [Conoideocrella luteorostrata]